MLVGNHQFERVTRPPPPHHLGAHRIINCRECRIDGSVRTLEGRLPNLLRALTAAPRIRDAIRGNHVGDGVSSLAGPALASDPVRTFAFPVAAVNTGRNLLAGTAHNLLPSGGTGVWS